KPGYHSLRSGRLELDRDWTSRHRESHGSASDTSQQSRCPTASSCGKWASRAFGTWKIIDCRPNTRIWRKRTANRNYLLAYDAHDLHQKWLAGTVKWEVHHTLAQSLLCPSTTACLTACWKSGTASPPWNTDKLLQTDQHNSQTQGNTMTKTLLSTALVAVLGTVAFLPAARAAANSGTINITGKVVADTCQLNVNGTKNGSVVLPTVTTATLNAAVGATAGATAFNLTLTNCDTTATSASLNFTTGANNAADGNLTNTGTAGSNVEVQLLNGGTGGSVINVASNNN